MGLADLDKVYSPKAVEERWYQFWESHGLFHAEPNLERIPYTIVIPPPNVTGILHLGHVLNNTLQDILIRWKRMAGFEVLWMPGTDHAGIATQNVVERKLAQQGLTRQDLGRERFVKEVWQWKDQQGSHIIQQLKILGCSCDWQRERFTMDEGLSRAVREVFVRLYKKGLIYRGKRIINWCPRCGTALSDEEAENRQEEGRLWHIRYPIKGQDGYVVVATTRPETMLGDTAVAVHPADSRYQDLIGKTVILPLVNRELPVIADDEWVDPAFGSGLVKVTPAHDRNDFEMGQKHALPQINILNPDATMNEQAGERYAGMDRFACRQAVVEALQAQGLVEKVEAYGHAVPHCYRCDTVLEPYLSDQWFVRMKSLAEPALRVVQETGLKFYPERWRGVYLHWMENIRDWCISRQLWWGHRIPVWYCDDCNALTVSTEDPSACEQCGSQTIHQDEDVLDTWFSSALWPFSTMGWPEQTAELDYFYPTNTLITGHEIIFFWVARMVMTGLAFMQEAPFFDVYLHGIVRDHLGRKMSKSLGNSPDPIDIIARYGADALRFAMVLMAPTGQDIHYTEERVSTGRNFVNKVWNAARFVLMNLDPEITTVSSQQAPTNLVDRWIQSRLHRAVSGVTRALDKFEFNEAGRILYDFLWHDYCDWYLELIKPRLYNPISTADRHTAQWLATTTLETAVRLLHPFMPFATEEIWQQLVKVVDGNVALFGYRGAELKGGKASIMLAPWPDLEQIPCSDTAEQEMGLLQDIVSAIRNLRAEFNLPPGQKIPLLCKVEKAEQQAFLERHQSDIVYLARLNQVTIGSDLSRPPQSAVALVTGIELYIPLADLIDLEVETQRLTREQERVTRQLSKVRTRLSNQQFLEKAPSAVVAKEQAKENHYEGLLTKLRHNLQALSE